MPHYDLAVIGSGSGNSLVTPAMAGWDIAIIDEGVFGGTCLNTGCIPTKMYVYAADLAELIGQADRFGLDANLRGVRWCDIRDRIFGRIDPISAGGREYRRSGPGTTLYEARARFAGPHELALSTGETLTADRIVIATGSRPAIPAAVAQSGVPYLTSNDVLRMEELPDRLAILGGGYIAAEFAHVLSAFGVEVTVIARSAPLLRHLDADIADRFTALAEQRWDVHLGAGLAGLTTDGDRLRIDLTGGPTIKADRLLVATGRVPNSDRLDLPAAGVQIHPDGRVRVDAHQRTTAPGIWALGDVCSPHQLKHVSNHEARVVAHNLTVPPDDPDGLLEADHRFVPSAVFTSPQIATVGLTEAAARAAGADIAVAVQSFGGTAYGWAMEDSHSVCKVVADRASGQILGAHILGPQASTLIQPIVQAMTFGQSAGRTARTPYWIHPALTEVVENALLALNVP